MYGSSGLPANYACQLGLRDLTCEDPSREEYGLKVQECMCEPNPCTTHRMSLSHRSALLGSPRRRGRAARGREDGGHPGHPALYGCPCSLNPTLAVQCWRAVMMTSSAFWERGRICCSGPCLIWVLEVWHVRFICRALFHPSPPSYSSLHPLIPSSNILDVHPLHPCHSGQPDPEPHPASSASRQVEPVVIPAACQLSDAKAQADFGSSDTSVPASVCLRLTPAPSCIGCIACLACLLSIPSLSCICVACKLVPISSQPSLEVKICIRICMRSLPNHLCRRTSSSLPMDNRDQSSSTGGVLHKIARHFFLL